MASPPPPSSQLNLPKKRPSITTTTSSSQPNKRRLTEHPLRQTSFPAPDASSFVATPSSAYPRSETGSVASGYSKATASLVDGIPGKRGRGRPRKVGSVAGASTPGPAQGAADESQSVTRGEGSVFDGQTGTRNGGTAEGDEDDEEADDVGDVGEDWAEWEEREMKLLEILYRSFNPEQAGRYEMFKRVKLKESVLKRIVNQIVSQSVTKVPLIAINAYTKYFAGEIVELARDVQKEYAEAYDRILEEKWREQYKAEESRRQKERATASNGVAPTSVQPTTNATSNTNGISNSTDPKSPDIKIEQGKSPSDTALAAASPKSTVADAANTANQDSGPQLDVKFSQSLSVSSPTPPLSSRKLPPPPHPLTSLTGYENPHRGGLLPDHLREALRRYKQDGEGGGVGLDGLSNPGLGTKGRASWRVGGTFGGSGKRLFG